MVQPKRSELEALVGVFARDRPARGAPREVGIEPAGVVGIERFADPHRSKVASALVLAVEPVADDARHGRRPQPRRGSLS